MRVAVALPILTLAAAACALGGWSRRAPSPAKATPVGPAAVATAAGLDVPVPTSGVHGARKKEGLDVPVYVDGRAIAALRFGELPPSLTPHATADRKDERYYGVAEYLAAVGVPVDQIRAVHFRGNGQRVASVEGAELRAEPARFAFHFTDKETGIARTAWSTKGLKNLFRLDEIRELFVFVARPAPAVAPERACYLDAKGECGEQVPYADEKLAKGTRVYLDGRLVGQVKRRKVEESLAAGADKDNEGRSQYPLAHLLSSYGVDLQRAGSVELYSGDDLVGRGTGRDLVQRTREASFVIPAHAHGRVRVAVPTAWQSRDAEPQRDIDVSAVVISSSPALRARSLVPLAEADTLDLLPSLPSSGG